MNFRAGAVPTTTETDVIVAVVVRWRVSALVGLRL
jgi:hypothetical protein